MSLFSVSWTLFSSSGLWHAFHLDCILNKGDQLPKFICKFKHLRIENLPQDFVMEEFLINVEFLKNKTEEITAGIYLLPTAQIVNVAQQVGTRALLIVNNYIFEPNLGNRFYTYLWLI